MALFGAIALVALLGVSLMAYLVWHFLLSLPKPQPEEEQAFLGGKVVWITGASSGIGKALAEHLRAHPTTKVVLSARNEATLSAVAASLSAAGLRGVMVLPLDLESLASDAALAAAAVSAVEERFSRVDVLIHNGGMTMRGDAASTSLDVDMRLMNCNFLGAVSLTKAVLPGMIARRSGSILAMSSVQGRLPIAFRSSYAASKHAMHAYFTSLRYEVAEFGIHVSILTPGYVKTNLSLNAVRGDGRKYGKMDDTTAAGYDPSFIAALSYAALQQRVGEVVVADLKARVAIMLYALAPQLLSQILIKRANKERQQQANEQKTD